METGFKEMNLTEKQLDSTEIFNGKLLRVFKDSVLLPNGEESTREYIKHIGAVAVVAMDNEGRIAVEHQFRYPFAEELMEIPAGKLDSEDEDPLEAAKRELREETGITASEFEYMGPFYPTCAYSNEVIHLYFAWNLSFGERSLDEDESINVEMIDLNKMVQLIFDGKIPDGKTQAAVLQVVARLRAQ